MLTPEELLDVTGYKEDYVRVLILIWLNFKDDSLKGDLLRKQLQAEQIITSDNEELPVIDVETAQNIVINLLSARNGTDYNLVYSFRRYLQQGVNQKRFLEAVIKNLLRQNISYAELQGSLARSVSFDNFRQMLDCENKIDIRFLTLVNTQRLVTEASNPEQLLIKDDTKALSTIGQRWTVGLDIAGPEEKMFTHVGMERFKLIHEQIKLYAQEKNATFIIRVHVGEGYFQPCESQEDNNNGEGIDDIYADVNIYVFRAMQAWDLPEHISNSKEVNVTENEIWVISASGFCYEAESVIISGDELRQIIQSAKRLCSDGQ
ncbi:MAG: hypothetical protein KME64_02070 [Scytonematopsis contorta HA4267-MV1]|nr:hypothetical protein [Scytonematopsis contorta HA4267-MV1]